MIDLSVIIVNYNGENFLNNLLNSIHSKTKNISCEIIIIDNHSSDGSVGFIKTYFPQVNVIENKENLGFSKANNQGLKIYQGRYALLLNNDTVLNNDAFDRMVEFMDNHPEVGACGPKLLNTDGTIQPQGSNFGRKFWLSRFPNKVNFVIGACLMARRETIDKVGFLDENLFFANDDLDWCLRIRKAGWLIYSLPQAEVIHFGGFTTRLFNQKLFVEGFRGGLYFCKKHYGNFIYQIYRLILISGLAIMAFLSFLFYPFLKNKQFLNAYLQILAICIKGEIIPKPSPLSPLPKGEGNRRDEDKKVLFITNGHGEDLVAAEIIKRRQEHKIFVLPLVGKGSAFENLPVEILGSRKKMPGGGFSFRNIKFLLQDITAGLMGDTFENIKILKALRNKIDLTIAIGDIVPITGALIAKAPFIFVGVNKSDYYQWFGYNYTPWEKWLLRKYAKKIFVRDRLTAKNLNREGIPAEYVGNPLMDCIGKMTNDQFPMTNEGKIILGLLPGTRNDAKLNLEDFEKVVEELINLKDPDTQFKFLVATSLPEIPEYMERKPFAKVLAESDLIIGLSGTGNEQAAGCGIPIVSFYGRGAQYNRKFAQAQKQLLGEALELVRTRDPLKIALAIFKIMRTPEKIKKMGAAGRERMGECGAVEKIGAYITGEIK